MIINALAPEYNPIFNTSEMYIKNKPKMITTDFIWICNFFRNIHMPKNKSKTVKLIKQDILKVAAE